jgi:hypothetical protein
MNAAGLMRPRDCRRKLVGGVRQVHQAINHAVSVGVSECIFCVRNGITEAKSIFSVSRYDLE